MIKVLDPPWELSVFSIFFCFLLATGCSAVIGYERSKSRRAAGLRTHIIVCIGAASVMLLSQYLAAYADPNTDPARLGAQVISGIGFLGAGTIVITGHQLGQRVRGLTTAAGLWASACMGLLIGGGVYEAAVIMCAFLFCVIAGLNRLEEKYLNDSTVMRFYIEYSIDMPFSFIHAELRKKDRHSAHFEQLNNAGGRINSIIMDVQHSGQPADGRPLLETLRSMAGVLFAEDV